MFWYFSPANRNPPSSSTRPSPTAATQASSPAPIRRAALRVTADDSVDEHEFARGFDPVEFDQVDLRLGGHRGEPGGALRFGGHPR